MLLSVVEMIKSVFKTVFQQEISRLLNIDFALVFSSVQNSFRFTTIVQLAAPTITVFFVVQAFLLFSGELVFQLCSDFFRNFTVIMSMICSCAWFWCTTPAIITYCPFYSFSILVCSGGTVQFFHKFTFTISMICSFTCTPGGLLLLLIG